MPTASAAAFDRLITRLWAYGPRSLIRTTTDLPVCSFVTRTLVPNGRVLCAAVRSLVLKVSPLYHVPVTRTHRRRTQRSFASSRPGSLRRDRFRSTRSGIRGLHREGQLRDALQAVLLGVREGVVGVGRVANGEG